MRIIEFRYVRWILVGIIIGILLAVGFNYYQSWRQRTDLTQQAPRMLSEEMLRSAEAIEYTDYRNGVIQFKIRAEKLLETREGVNILEGLEAADYDPGGTIRNRIRSRRGEYDRAKRKVLFSEDVQIRLGSEAELRTSSLQYDLMPDVGSTEDLVELKMRNASGSCRGVRYFGGKKSIELISDIDLTFAPPPEDADSPPPEPVRVHAQRGYYAAEADEVRFSGSARIETAGGELSGEQIIAKMDPSSKRLASVVCAGDAIYKAGAEGETSVLSGHQITVFLHPRTRVAERILVEKEASFRILASGQQQQLAAEEIQLELGEHQASVRQLIGNRSVQYRLLKSSGLTVIEGDALQAAFQQGQTSLKDMRISGNARLKVGGSANENLEELTASEIRAAFDDQEAKSGLRELTAEKSVRWTSLPRRNEITGKRIGGYSMNADFLQLLYAKSGDYLETGHAVGNVVLTSVPAEQDPSDHIRQLRCDTVRLKFFPKLNRMSLFEGEGHVESLFQGKQGGVRPGEVPSYRTFSSAIRATFEEMDGAVSAASQWGNFIYRDGERTVAAGRADYSSMNKLLVLHESPSVTDVNGTTTGNIFEYHQDQKVLHIKGRVQSILRTSGGGRGGFGGAGSENGQESIITASEMRYWLEDSRAVYSGGIKLFSADGQLRAGSLSLTGSGDEIEARDGIHHILFMQGSVPRAGSQSGESAAAGEAAEPLTIRSAALRYTRNSNSLHYSGDVRLESSQAVVSSQELDAVLDASGQRIQFAAARKQLRIAQEGREAEGDEAFYYPSEGKFIVTGELARIRDPKRGDSAARRLTFYTSNDRILLENRR